MSKKLAVMYLLVALAGILGGVCVPTAYYARVVNPHTVRANTQVPSSLLADRR